MKLCDIPENRSELDKIERAILAQRWERRCQKRQRSLARWREKLLTRIGSNRPGLLLWYFGASGASHDPSEIPVRKIAQFAAHYT